MRAQATLAELVGVLKAEIAALRDERKTAGAELRFLIASMKKKVAEPAHDRP